MVSSPERTKERRLGEESPVLSHPGGRHPKDPVAESVGSPTMGSNL